MDFVLLFLLWLSFASLSTLHVALAFVVGQRLGPLQGWLGLLAFPLAPYFGLRAGLKWRPGIWCLLVVCYSVLLFLAAR